jgi:hypothetical protein
VIELADGLDDHEKRIFPPSQRSNSNCRLR